MAYRLGQTDGTYALNFLLCILGALLGWIPGILAAPFDPREATTFATLGQTLSAFLSGYLLSKFDRFLDKAFYSTGDAIVVAAWQRLGLFATSLLLMTLVVFVNRSYLHRTSEEPSTGSTTGVSAPDTNPASATPGAARGTR